MQGRIQKIKKGVAGTVIFNSSSYSRYFLVFLDEIYKNNTKFQGKRGERDPLGLALNLPMTCICM